MSGWCVHELVAYEPYTVASCSTDVDNNCITQNLNNLKKAYILVAVWVVDYRVASDFSTSSSTLT
jgi:hypothetical protein